MARQVKVITAAEAAALIKNGDTVTTSGFVASAIPEALDRAVEERFLATGEPRDITYVYCGSQGNKDGPASHVYRPTCLSATGNDASTHI